MKKTALTLGMAAALAAGAVTAHEAGSVILRGGGILVTANSTSSTKTATEINLDVNNNAQLGLTGTYMFTDHIGLELLAATPFSHKVSAYIPALDADLGDVAKVKHLPPSLYVQYYFLDKDAGSRPYIGAGLNYTRFFDSKSTNPLITDLKIKKHSFGPVVNAGIDIKLTDNLYFNTAMWYTHIRTNANFNALNTNHEVKIKLDPVIFFAGLAYNF